MISPSICPPYPLTGRNRVPLLSAARTSLLSIMVVAVAELVPRLTNQTFHTERAKK